MAVSKVGTISLLDAFVASNATMQNGYYTMQGMTPAICNAATIGSSLQLLDVRDGKLYWVTKLADNNCWMTQNLDLDLDSNRTYTHWDTDLGWGDPDNLDANASWQPDNSTIDFSIGSIITGWQDSGTEPYSANPGDVYFYTSNSDANDIQYNSLQECANVEHSDCLHYHIGNYYNWSATVASNSTEALTKKNTNAPNSICPKGWRLPMTSSKEFKNIIDIYSIDNSGALQLRLSPLYFTRSGYVQNRFTIDPKNKGRYWSSTIAGTSTAYNLFINSANFDPSGSGSGKSIGFSVRCLVR